MKKVIRSLTATALLIAGCVPMDAATHWLSFATLKRELEAQGFSGGFEKRVHISRLGEMDCAGGKLQVYYYAWEATRAPYHAAYRVVFFKNSTTYLGQFVVGSRPKLSSSNTLAFRDPESDEKSIQCDEIGQPEVLFKGGDTESLFK